MNGEEKLSYKWRYIKDKVFVVIVILMSLVALVPILHLICTVIFEGFRVLVRGGLSFVTEIPPPPTSHGLGGVAPALVGSFILITVSTPLTITIALLASILSTEFPGNYLSKLADAISRSLASVPTIIVSMVVYSLVVLPMRKFSLLAGAIALTIISLPYAYTSFATALRSVPRTYKEASYSVGMNRWKSVLLVSLPIVRKAIIAGVLMSSARAMGETAALLFTVGRNRSSVNYHLLQPGDALPLLIFDFVTTPFRTYHEIAWGASLILMFTYLVVFTLVKVVVKEVKL